MDYSKEDSTSVYGYADKTVQQAGYAAIAFAVVSAFTGVLAYIQYFLYHRPGTGGFQGHEFLSQQYLKHTPLVTGVVVASAAIIASTSGVLAFFIFRSSRFAIVVMLAFVTLLQLYTWLVAHSFAGTILSIVVVAFLLRGAKRIFEDHAERSVGTQKL